MEKLKKPYLITIFFGVFFSIFYYGILFQKINALEFWADEVISLRNARHPEYAFRLGEMETTLHIPAAAYEPPLHNFMLSHWQTLINQLEIKEYYEFYYRIPFMAFHSLASILFALLALKFLKKEDEENRERIIWFILVFLFYFLNPFLFRYSLEMRPYAFAELSSVFILILYFYKKLHQFIYLPLLILFLFNSFSTIIFIIPLYIFYAMTNKIYKKRILVLAIFVIGVTILLSQLVYFGNSYRLNGVTEGLQNFIRIQFNGWQIIVWFLMIGLSFRVYRRQAAIVFITILVSFFGVFLALCLSGNTFFPRYIAFLIPSCLLLTTMFLWTQQRWIRRIILIIIAMVFLIPWSLNIAISFEEVMFPYRNSIGAKSIAVWAQKNKYGIIILNSHITRGRDYDFNINNTFDWYMEEYGVNFERPEDIGIACDKYMTQNNVLYVSLLNNELCDSINQHRTYIGETIIYSHEPINL